MTVGLAFGITQAPAFAQDPAKPAEAPKKVAKDQAEADLINGIAKEADAKKRLDELQRWQQNYPQTAFENERKQAFLFTYTQLGDCRGAAKAATDILQTEPNNEPALQQIIVCIYSLKGATQSDYDLATKTAAYVTSNVDAIFAESNRGQIPAATWTQLKASIPVAAKHVPAFIDMQKKDDAKAEADLRALLTADPNDGQASYWLAGVLFGQREKKPEDQPPAIFEYARAGLYEGPGAMDAATRKTSLSAAQRFYKIYHGSDEGWDKLAAVAKTNALPPADFHIDSTTDIAIIKQKAQEAADAADPVFAIWRTIKEGLTGDNSDAFFESSVKDSGLPSADGSKKFSGKLVSQKPALSPKTLVIAYKDPAGDITLELPTPLRGKMEPGADLEFWGVATAYTKSPFMLTLKIADPKTDIVGWKPIVPATSKKAGGAVRKKAQ